MDYGPDWPPVPSPPSPPSPPPRPERSLLRRCVSITLIWAAIWMVCALALSFRQPYELRFPTAHSTGAPPAQVAATP